jgi:hypothetical protein
MYVQAGHTATGEKNAPVTNLVKQTRPRPTEIKTRHNNLHTAHQFYCLHPTTSFGLVQVCIMI